jgi:oxygen-independent coproporphyrinogen-3 oxidase
MMNDESLRNDGCADRSHSPRRDHSSFIIHHSSLISKYDRPGPRYTSYPPATRFAANFDRARIEERLRVEGAASPASIYIHIPFCAASCWFCACHSIVSRNRATIDRYLDLLEREMDRRGFTASAPGAVSALHWGGGSPSSLAPDQIARLGAALGARIRPTADFEAAIELDPRDLGEEKIAALHDVGLTRASLGVQSTDAGVQKAINRVQPLSLVEEAMARLRAAGFSSLNIDLVYGLPRQTERTFARTLAETIALKPDRFAIFNFAHVPWMKPVQKLIRADDLPTPETKIRLLLLAIERLNEAGYLHIGMDHFARPEDPLAAAWRAGRLRRNFQGYTTDRAEALHAFGVTAISATPSLYLQNERGLAAYGEAIAARRLPLARALEVTPEEALRRAVIMRVMCAPEVDLPALSAELGVDVAALFEEELKRLAPLEEDGLIERTPRGFRITPLGRILLRNIAMAFDTDQTVRDGRYSRTV